MGLSIYNHYTFLSWSLTASLCRRNGSVDHIVEQHLTDKWSEISGILPLLEQYVVISASVLLCLVLYILDHLYLGSLW